MAASHASREKEGRADTSASQYRSSGDETQIVERERGVLNACIIVMTVTSGMIINIANSTTTAIALPTIEKEWMLEPAQLQWIVSAYPLSSGCLFLMFGRLADVYGRKKTFCAGSLFLAVLTLACGFAPNVMTLDILRGFQGIGAAATIPASLGILAHSFPPSRARSLAFATFSAGAPIGAVFGTAIGGVLTEYTAKTWRSSFFLLAALTVLCFFGGLVSIDPDVPSAEVDKRIDWIGGGLVTAGLVCIVFVLSQGELAKDGWGTDYIVVLLILGVILVGVFLYWQHYLETLHASFSPFHDPSPNLSTRTSLSRTRTLSPVITRPPSIRENRPPLRPRWVHDLLTPPPLMRLSIWTRARGRFAAMMGIAFMNWCAFLAWTFWVQLYYQNHQGYNPIQTVVRLLPMFISGIACNAFVGLMAAHVPVVYLIAIGASATTVACLLFAIIDPSVTYFAYAFPATLLSVMGADFVFSAGTLFVATAALPHEQSVGGALFNTMTQLGTAVGVTVTTVVADNVGQKVRPGEDNIETYRAAQWTCFGFGVIATCLGVIFFRGVGVVGHHAPRIDVASKKEQGGVSSMPHAAGGMSSDEHGTEVTIGEKRRYNENLTPPDTPSTIGPPGTPEREGEENKIRKELGEHQVMIVDDDEESQTTPHGRERGMGIAV